MCGQATAVRVTGPFRAARKQVCVVAWRPVTRFRRLLQASSAHRRLPIEASIMTPSKHAAAKN